MTQTATTPPTFRYYLDAWLYAFKAGLPLSAIKHVEYNVYIVEH